MKICSFILLLQILFFSSCVSANAIQQIKPESQEPVSNARQNAEQLPVKITDGAKDVTKDPIQKLNDFVPKSSFRRRLNTFPEILEQFQEMTSYKDFTKDVKKLNLYRSFFIDAQSYVFEVLKEFEAEAGYLHNSMRNRVTVAKLLAESPNDDFTVNEEFRKLGKQFVHILKTRFAELGMFEVLAKFINGLRVHDKPFRLLFPYSGKYLPIMKTALMNALAFGDDTSNEIVSTEPQSGSSEEWFRPHAYDLMPVALKKVDEKSIANGENVMENLKIDKEDMNALRSLGLKSLKLVLLNVPNKNDTDLGESGKNEEVKPRENDELNKHNVDISLPNHMKKEMRLPESSKNVETKHNSARSSIRSMEQPENEPSQAKAISKPDATKFAQMAAAFGIPRFSDVNEDLNKFWPQTDLDVEVTNHGESGKFNPESNQNTVLSVEAEPKPEIKYESY